MKRKLFVALFIWSSLYASSYLFQASIHQPPLAITAASHYETVQLALEVREVKNMGYEVEVVSGQLPRGTIGQVHSKFILQVGDWFDAKVFLSPAPTFSRAAFWGKVSRVDSAVRHSEQLRVVNRMRSWAAGQTTDAKCLVSGLSIGIDTCLTQRFREDMKRLGLTHLTAVSGANCVIVIGAFWFLLRFFGAGRGMRFLASLVLLFAYVGLVGWQPSVLRAAFMTTVILVAVELGQKIRPLFALVFGSAILLIVDPWLIGDLGFWLSALATAGLVSYGKPVFEKLSNWFPKPIAVGLAAAIVPQFLCLPILVWLQGGFPTYSILANLLVEPVVAPVTVLGLLAVLFSPVFPWLAVLLMQVAAALSSWIVCVSNVLPRNANSMLPMAPFWFIAPVLVLIVWAMARRSLRSIVTAALGVAVVLSYTIASILSAHTWHSDNWQIVSCDVGQGDAMLIRSDGRYALIDTGRDEQLISECLDDFGVYELDLLVLTHFDFDHVGGTAGAIRGRSVKRVLISAFPDERPESRLIRKLVQQSASEVIEAPLGLSGHLGDVGWRVFSALGVNATTSNEGSLGIRFESANWVLWTLADLPETAQVSARKECSQSTKLTIVKVSHHGSADQSPRFYECIAPDFAIVSVGASNSYGHPTKRLLEILDQLNVKAFRTDQLGSIDFEEDAGAFQFKWQGR